MNRVAQARLAPVFFGALAFGAVAAASACADVVDLKVAYTDAGVDASSSVTDDGGHRSLASHVAAQEDAATSSVAKLGNGDAGDPCPCDQTEGLSCCVPATGGAFCTVDAERCDAAQGALWGCFAPDPTTESVCCWHGSGTGAITAYAGGCANGPEVCRDTSDCSDGSDCIVATCAGVTIGTCGTAPTCPAAPVP